jgi:protoheme IX farnesyltransferase
MIKTYYLLTKPGIIMGNLITTTSGFLLASKGHFNIWLFLATLVGLGSVIASACVFNNYIDRESDKKMARTKNRALPQGIISGKNALVFAVCLGILGALVLSLYTNVLSVVLTAVGFIVYVGCYSLWKHHSSSATLVGSIAGAIPPVVGYSAVSGRFDLGAVLFFLILVLWQMPHFFSIAMYRLDDYANASIPTLPGERGIVAAKFHILLYIIAFLIATSMLIVFGYTGFSYLVVVSFLGLVWLGLSIRGFRREDHVVWARSMFRVSLVVIMGLSLMISFDAR